MTTLDKISTETEREVAKERNRAFLAGCHACRDFGLLRRRGGSSGGGHARAGNSRGHYHPSRGGSESGSGYREASRSHRERDPSAGWSARSGTGAAWQYAAVQRYADLRANQRLPERWYFDIGAHVKQGDLLAEIDTPEIDKQLQQARAELETAQANYHLAETTAARWHAPPAKQTPCRRQETDEKVADLSAKKATVDSNASNVRRLEDLQSFQKVYAPFDGVLTARNTDIGALDRCRRQLARARSCSTSLPSTRCACFVAVPEVYSRAARPGATASLTLDEFPGRSFRGTLVRTSNAIDQASRTLLTEVDVQNPDGELLPGAYVSVHLKLPQTFARSWSLPTPCSSGRKVCAWRWFATGACNWRRSRFGRDYGSTVEVISGLQAIDAVVLGSGGLAGERHAGAKRQPRRHSYRRCRQMKRNGSRDSPRVWRACSGRVYGRAQVQGPRCPARSGVSRRPMAGRSRTPAISVCADPGGRSSEIRN